MSRKSVGVRSFVTPGHLRHVEARGPTFRELCRTGSGSAVHITQHPADDPWRLSRSHAPGKDDDRRSPFIHSQSVKRICYLLLYFLSVCLLQVRSVCVYPNRKYRLLFRGASYRWARSPCLTNGEWNLIFCSMSFEGSVIILTLKGLNLALFQQS